MDRLLPLVYDELRRLARRQVAREYGAVTLSATDLVHEAYLKLAGLVVYRKLGLRLLRTMWVNLDRVWGAALIATGVGTLLV